MALGPKNDTASSLTNDSKTNPIKVVLVNNRYKDMNPTRVEQYTTSQFYTHLSSHQPLIYAVSCLYHTPPLPSLKNQKRKITTQENMNEPCNDSSMLITNTSKKTYSIDTKGSNHQPSNLQYTQGPTNFSATPHDNNRSHDKSHQINHMISQSSIDTTKTEIASFHTNHRPQRSLIIPST